MLSLEGNRLGLLLGALILLAGLLYRETAMAIWGLWNNNHIPTYSHGPLLLLVCLYILYREWRNNKDELALNISYFGMMGLLGSGLLWFLAALGSVQIIQMLSLVAVFAFMFIGVLGYHQAKAYLFPILLTIGALPVWEVVLPYLQLNTAVVAGWLTSLTIQPSIREGMLINIPAGSFAVEATCSGLAYFIVSIIISLLFVYSHRLPIKQSLFFVLAAMLVAIVANIIRVYIIIVSGQLTEMQSYFITQEHVSLGWGIFAIGISFFLWLAGRLVANQPSGAAVVNGPEEGKTASQTQIDNNQLNERQGSEALHAQTIPPIVHSGGTWAFVISMVIVAVITGPLANAAYRINPAQVVNFQVQLPDEVNGWKKIPYTGSYRPRLQKGDVMQEASFFNTGEDSRIYLLVNYFYRQRQDAEAVSDMNRFATDRNWSRIGSHKISPGLADFADIEETRLRARNGEEKLVWYWYETNGYRTSRDWLAKLQNIIGILRGKPSIRIIVLAVDPKSDISNARTQLRTFLQNLESRIHIVPQPI